MFKVIGTNNLINASEMLLEAALTKDNIRKAELVVDALEQISHIKRNANFEYNHFIPILKAVFINENIKIIDKENVINILIDLGFQDEADYIDYFFTDKDVKTLFKNYVKAM